MWYRKYLNNDGLELSESKRKAMHDDPTGKLEREFEQSGGYEVAFCEVCEEISIEETGEFCEHISWCIWCGDYVSFDHPCKHAKEVLPAIKCSICGDAATMADIHKHAWLPLDDEQTINEWNWVGVRCHSAGCGGYYIVPWCTDGEPPTVIWRW